MSLLRYTELVATNSAGAMRAVAVAILVWVALRDCLAPRCTTLEVNVLDVGASINDVDINTFATIGSVIILVEVAEAEGFTVGETSQTPWSTLLELGIGVVVLVLENMDFLIPLNVGNLCLCQYRYWKAC